MFSIEPCPTPKAALLNKYHGEETYTDCYVTNFHGSVSLPQFVTAFYTTPVFRLERFILKIAISRPSTDAQASQLADGTTDTFAAWDVEARNENQILMSDFHRRTRSWLMVSPAGAKDNCTRLYFGSAVVPVKNPETGQRELGRIFRLLLGFHKVYSVVLLYAARLRLKAQQHA